MTDKTVINVCELRTNRKKINNVVDENEKKAYAII